MRYYIIFGFLLIQFLGYAQGFKVRHKLPGTLNNSSKAIFETSPGNYITGGIIFDSLNGNYSNRLCIMGLDAQGQIQWVKKYGNYQFEYLDNTLISRSYYKLGNHLYYTGCVRDNNKFIGVLIKFDLNGDTIWQKTYRDSADDVIPQMVTSSVDGGFLLTGFFQSWTSFNSPCLIIKTDGDGKELWRKRINKVAPNVHDGRAIIQDSISKKIIIVGYQNIGNANSWSTQDNVLILDSLGTKLSQNTFGGFGGVLGDLIQTKDKKIVAVGQKIYANTVAGTHLTKSFAIKFDVDSPVPLIWKIDGFDKMEITNFFTCIRELPNGDLLMGGVIDTLRLHNLNVNCLTRLTRVTPNGTITWNTYYDYKTNGANMDNFMGSRSIELTSDGGWVAAIECINSPSPNPFLFVKYDSLGCDSTLAYCAMRTVTAGIERNYLGEDDVLIFPNPSSGLFYLSLPSELEGAELNVIVCDISGRKVKQIKLVVKQSLDLNDLSNGVYVLTVSRDNEIVYKGKVVKQE